jgi:hypothetical protein
VRQKVAGLHLRGAMVRELPARLPGVQPSLHRGATVGGHDLSVKFKVAFIDRIHITSFYHSIIASHRDIP